MFNNYSYLIYMLIFTVIPIVVMWAKNYAILRKNIRVIGMTTFIAIIYQLIADPFAESWEAWYFSDDRILGIWLSNFPVENMLFFALVAIAISSATVTYIHYEKTGKLKKLFRRT